MSKSSSASVEAANINGANDLTQGNVNSVLLLFADGIKEYLALFSNIGQEKLSNELLSHRGVKINCYVSENQYKSARCVATSIHRPNPNSRVSESTVCYTT